MYDTHSWDTAYRREVTNFNDHGDVGEVWFGEDSVDKMADWVETHIDDHTAPILDLGCGNGHLLLELAAREYTNLCGVDYSEPAIQLSRTIANTQLGPQSPIRYHQLDLLDDQAVTEFLADPSWTATDKARVVLDKGTFDAISLGEAGSDVEMDPKRRYQRAVSRLLADGDDDHPGVLLITSCNWTQDELIKLFAEQFEYHAHIRYPSFTFGGVQGQKICTVAFVKRKP
ncbi:Protein-lysine N-methyltransferase efm4 [Tieghemiomyces parasiticus]|uniref:Protein-lysine N-methyltransferase EFM4 n=1 Tax=Tieghemiomyces parasiticus TaxID=78921 RepID=A0A9W8ADR1_9FUNG|nr:Protein-lysine N-methyltransferase efm4 [Tieghemiomyces parasiticus]